MGKCWSRQDNYNQFQGGYESTTRGTLKGQNIKLDVFSEPASFSYHHGDPEDGVITHKEIVHGVIETTTTTTNSGQNGEDTFSTGRKNTRAFPNSYKRNFANPPGERRHYVAKPSNTDKPRISYSSCTSDELENRADISLSKKTVLSDSFLNKVAAHIGAEWQTLSISIGLTNSEIEQIDFERGFNSRTKIFKALILWRSKVKQKHAVGQLQTLIDALRENGRYDLADKYFKFLEENMISHISVIERESDVNRLKQQLIEKYDLETRAIPLVPLQKGGEKLPIEQLFSSIVIKEGQKEISKRKRSVSGKQSKKINTPKDLFTKHERPVRYVFMLGDAAHGKTTYCMWLLKQWCSPYFNPLGKADKVWEHALKEFDFVFYLPFRRVDPSRADVVEMICKDLLGADADLRTAAQHVLSCGDYKCLIVMDGLDEWRPSEATKERLKHKGMPNIENVSNCVIFTTMRPCMYASVEECLENDAKVIEIKGLDQRGIKDVIEKVLIYHYEIEKKSTEYKETYERIIRKLKDKTISSFIKIPLLAVICVQIWCEGEEIEESMTSFYIAMVDMMIQRANIKVDARDLSNIPSNLISSTLLSTKSNIRNVLDILLKLGKVAFEGLLSRQLMLEFQKDQLENDIGKENLQLALDIGLISQREAFGILSKNVKIHFFHKSVQEFLAVFHIIADKDVKDSFCDHMSNVRVIMELSNMVMFVCGMCPSLGSVITQHVCNVTDNDERIRKFRETMALQSESIVPQLYKDQLSWHREFRYGQSLGGTPLTFYIADMCLWPGNSDIDTVKQTRELLCNDHVNIRSLYFWEVPHSGGNGISNELVHDFLTDKDKTKSMDMIHLYSSTSDRVVPPICLPPLRFLDLYNVTIKNTIKDSLLPAKAGPFLSDMSALKKLNLHNISLENRELGLSPDMDSIQEIWLEGVQMIQAGWKTFIQSLVDIPHTFEVCLLKTDVDFGSLSLVRSSPHFKVKREEFRENFVAEYSFTRI